MVKRILRRTLILIIVLLMVMATLPMEDIGVYAASLATDISGLSASYDNGTWTASGSTLQGIATGEAATQCGSASAQTSTLTLTNSSGSTAVLAFEYTKPSLGSGGSVTIDGTAVTAAGSFSKELAANGTVKVVIVSGSAGSYSSSITLNNVSVVPKTTVTTTFVTTTGGSYTVDGAAVTEDITRTQYSTEPYAVVATPISGYKFVGWYSVNTDTYLNTSASTNLYVTSNSTIRPVFVTSDTAIWEVGTKVFFDLNQAITYSTSNNISKITLIGSGSLPAGNYTIPSGKTVLIPFDSTKTLYTTTAGIMNNNVYGNASGVPSEYVRLTMQNGAKITINGGLSVSSKLNSFNNYYTAANIGKYGYIYMNDGSSIDVANGGKLYCWGFISGQGEVTAKSGSAVYEPFQICDMRGGTALNSMKSNSQKVMPFTQYYINNIEAALTIEYGATDYAVSTITISGSTSTPEVNFVSNSSSALFRLENGSSFRRTFDPATDRTTYEISGNASLNSVSMNVYVSINTANFVLPIMENTDLRIHSGTTTINQDICVIPGCQIAVDNGATVKVASGKNVYLYDLDEWAGKGFTFPSSDTTNFPDCLPRQYSPTRAAAFNKSQMVDARVDLNGIIDATGKFYTTVSGADITSTEGTGRFVLTSAPTSSTTTYQATQSGSTISYTSISANAARLHNDEIKNPSNPYTATAGNSAGTTFTYSLNQGKWGNFRQFTVTFKNDDGSTFNTLTVTEGDTISEDLVGTPVKEGDYVFQGWFNGNDQLIFGETPITGNVTYTARWAETTYTYEEPTYVWSEDNSTCTATAVCVEDESRTKTETVNSTSSVTTEPTCETAGVRTYTATFQDELFTTQIKTVSIPAHGHTLVATPAAEPTCTEPGNTAYWTCGVCGKHFSDAVGTNEIAEGSWVIPALGHDYGEPSYTWSSDNSSVTARAVCSHDSSHVLTETVQTTSVTTAATCETAGSTTYTATFNNTEFQTQTRTVDIPALGHDYGEPTYIWADDNSSVTATTVCSHDASHVITETKPATSVTTQASCENDGSTVYTVTFADEHFTTQTKTVVIPAIGHRYGTPTYTWADDKSSVTATDVCLNDANHVVTETVQTTSSTTDATCEADGSTVYTAHFANVLFTDQSETVTIPALGHDYGDPTYVWSADNSHCTATMICSHDSSHVITETVDSTSVTTAATCETAGETVYTAEFTNGHFEKQTKTVAIPALGHDYGEPTYVWSENHLTCTATAICSHDASHVITETVDSTSAITSATCETAGATTYTATFLDTHFTTQTESVAIPATGHDWGTPVYTWADDNSQVTAVANCKNNPVHVAVETVDTTNEVTTPATCEGTGVKTYTATFTNALFSTQTKPVEIPATGHAYGEPTYVWTEDLSSVTATVVCANDASHTVTETVSTTNAVTTAAGCETTGVKTYTATFTNALFSTQTKPAEIPATGHAYGEPTYVWTEDLASVTATVVCANDASHVVTETVNTTGAVTTPPTCEGTGVKTYTATFTNALFTTQTETEVIPATGHAYGDPTYVWTEDLSGVTATVVCANDASHTVTETVSTTNAVTTAAGCETTGVRTYTATFTNELFNTQTKTEVIPATGHDYGTPTYEWAEDNTTVTATAICAHDAAHVLSETADTTKEVTPATCEAGGKTVYTAEFENSKFETQTKTVETPALGHTWGTPIYEWAEDNSTCTATVVCGNDPTHVQTEEGTVTSAVTTEPTCETAGERTYTATFENSKFETQTATEVIPAKGHTLTATQTVAPTCEEPGNSAYWTCEVCGKHFSDAEGTTEIAANSWILPALGHDLVETPAHPATCTEPGNNAYWTCTRCGKHFADAEAATAIAVDSWIIPASGHVWNSGEVTTEATCTHDGEMLYTCTVCGATRTEVIEQLAHTIREVAAVEPTCTQPGNYAYYVCDSCGHFFSDAEGTTEIEENSWIRPANGHTFGDWVVVESPTCVDEGSEQRTCIVCGFIETQNLDPNGHSWEEEFTIDQDPGCTTDGSKSKHCHNCDQVTDVTVIPALGHDWDTENIVWNWAEDYSSAEAVFTCKRDHSHTETITAAVTAETAAGIITHTAKVVFEEVTYTDVKTENAHEVLRIYGKSRYDTCIKIADYFMERNGLDKFPAVVLATGKVFPDALTGAYLANVNHAPIILIEESSAARITSYIKNNLAEGGKIFILGGQGAVGDDLIADLSGYDIRRLSGKSRYETNLSILKAAEINGGDIFVCTGTNYADSLSASGIDMPILIVGESLTDGQKEYLAQGSWNFHLVGGTKVVSMDIESELTAYGTIVDRTYGSDRFATSKAMAERFAGEAHEAVLAYGINFPDGLCGGPVAFSMGAPIVLSGSNEAYSSSGISYATGKNITSGVVLGGPKLIDDQTVRTTFSMRDSDEIKIYEE